MLSICIPTHDGRAALLDRLLESIAEQLEPEVAAHVEVCVSDNGSRDETSAVLARHRERFPAPLVTHRFERNDGFTPNLLKVMDIASGDFCWLLGSDDLIVPGGIAEVLALVEAHPDAAGITLNRFRVNAFEPGVRHLDPANELPADAEHAHVYRSAHAIFAEVGLLHDYISTQVVARELFAEVARGTSAAELARSGHFAHLLLLGRWRSGGPSGCGTPGHSCSTPRGPPRSTRTWVTTTRTTC
jgi:abequosyltransferase